VIAELQASGAASLRAIASALNERGIPTARGGKWFAASVRDVPQDLKGSEMPDYRCT